MKENFSSLDEYFKRQQKIASKMSSSDIYKLVKNDHKKYSKFTGFKQHSDQEFKDKYQTENKMENKTYKAVPITEEQFHFIWTLAVGEEGYNKKLFQLLLEKIKKRAAIGAIHSSVTAEELLNRKLAAYNPDWSEHERIISAMEEYAQLQTCQPSFPKITEYQLCPKCNGEGQLNNNGVSSSVFKVCDVCNGAKTLMKPVIQNASPSFPNDEEIEKKLLQLFGFFNTDIEAIDAKGQLKIQQFMKWLSSYIGESKKEDWISVEERLPDIEKFICYPYHLFEQKRTGHTPKSWIETFNITHWQPLPNPPKEEK